MIVVPIFIIKISVSIIKLPVSILYSQVSMTAILINRSIQTICCDHKSDSIFVWNSKIESNYNDPTIFLGFYDRSSHNSEHINHVLRSQNLIRVLYGIQKLNPAIFNTQVSLIKSLVFMIKLPASTIESLVFFEIKHMRSLCPRVLPGERGRESKKVVN